MSRAASSLDTLDGMIRFTCDRCERPLEVDDSLGGQKVECPHCGDINLAPKAAVAPPQAAARVDRAAAAGYPPDHGPEQLVLRVRPAMLRARPITFLSLTLALLAGVGCAIWFGALGHTPQWVMWPGIVVAAVAAGVLGWWKFQTLGAALEITNKRTIERRGIFSKATSEVLHDSIRNIQIEQTFWNRIWGVGSLGISSSGQDGIEIQVSDLPKPVEIRKIVDLYRPL